MFVKKVTNVDGLKDYSGINISLFRLLVYYRYM